MTSRLVPDVDEVASGTLKHCRCSSRWPLGPGAYACRVVIPVAGRPFAGDGGRRLVALGLRVGEPVRWRETAGGRWRDGSVQGSERDGSIAVVAGTGAARSLAVERLWVERTGRRGGRSWERLVERAGRSEQLDLLALLEPPAPTRRRR